MFEKRRNFNGVFFVILLDIFTKWGLITLAKSMAKSKPIGDAKTIAISSAKPKHARKMVT